MECYFGCFVVQIKLVFGVYFSEIKIDQEFKMVYELANCFVELEGCCFCIMVVKLGQDGYDCGVKVIVISFVDLGFDVDIGLFFQILEEVVCQVVENDVYILGIFFLVVGYKMFVLVIIKVLEVIGCEDIMVVVGGVIFVQDY